MHRVGAVVDVVTPILLAAHEAEVARLRTENEEMQKAVSRAERLWREATSTDVVLALQDCVTGSYEYGTQDGNFVAAYVAPTGPIHRAITVLQANARIVNPKAQEVMPPALASRIETEVRARVAAQDPMWLARAAITDAMEEGKPDPRDAALAAVPDAIQAEGDRPREIRSAGYGQGFSDGIDAAERIVRAAILDAMGEGT